MSRLIPPTALYREGERLIALRRPAPDWSCPPSVEEEWLLLWSQHLCGDALAETSVDDAANLCALGRELAAERGDWETALERIERWFQHPRLAEADRTDAVMLPSFRAQVCLYAGHLSTALAHYHHLLEIAIPRDRKLAHVIVRDHLYHYAASQPPESLAPTALTELAAMVIASFRGRKRLARTLHPGVTTYGELYTTLDRTYPEPVP